MTGRKSEVMEPIFFPDYKNSILNVTNSILHHYGAKTFHPTLPLLDQVLTRNYRNVVLILVDALGESILKKHPESGKTLANDVQSVISSVFPPTTVAATTSVLTGLSPLETGWIGWSQYVKEEDKTVVFFTNKDYYNESYTFNYPVAERFVLVENIYSLIQKSSPDVKTLEIFPAFREPHHDTFQKECETIVRETNEPGRHFIYSYWDKLDTNLHEFGPDDPAIDPILSAIDSGYAYLKNHISADSVIIVIADHGQVAVTPLPIRDYPDLWETFVHAPSVESRATAFFIIPGQESKFESLFRQYFGKHYVLYKTDDVLSMNLLGYGNPHPKLKEFLGDYMGIAIDHHYFKLNSDSFVMKGQHAGLLAEETLVPLIIYEKK